MYKIQPYDTPQGERYLMLDNEFKEVTEVSAFLEHLDRLNRSPNTIRSYAYDLLLLYRYMSEANINPLNISGRQQGYQLFIKFSNFLLTHDKTTIRMDKTVRADSSVNHIISTAFTYFSFLCQYGFINENLFPYRYSSGRQSYNFLSELTRAKVKKHPLLRATHHKQVKYITRNQYNLLLDACRTLRDRLIVSFLFEGGMRAGEVAGLHLSDLQEIEKGIIAITPRYDNINNARVKQNAGGKIKLPEYVINMLVQYLCDLDLSSEYLFTKTTGLNKGMPITTKSISRLFEDLSRRTGIRVHPHMCRHGFAIEKLESGWTLYEVQSYLRHASPVSTQVYAEYTDEIKIKRIEEFNRNIILPEVYKDDRDYD